MVMIMNFFRKKKTGQGNYQITLTFIKLVKLSKKGKLWLYSYTITLRYRVKKAIYRVAREAQMLEQLKNGLFF